MSEYIVDFGNTSEEYKAHFGRMAERVAGNRIREKIIRCEDCKHFKRGNLCSRPDEWNEFHWLDVEPEGFCKWGERKECGND